MELTAPQHPMMTHLEQNVIQWAAFDSLDVPVRATTHAYRSNANDAERLSLDEAIEYLRHAPVSDDATALTRVQVDTVIARLELQNTLLGGLVSEARAKRLGSQSALDRERTRLRNWELLRQWADDTDLIFEPLNLAGTRGHYAILWFSQERSAPLQSSSVRSIWTLLGIQNPWNDERMKQWSGPVYERDFGDSRPERVVPLAVYSLDYPREPLVLVDFRGETKERRHEAIQRSLSELTGGVLGLSHFTNWYAYLASDLYNFVSGRHGKSMDQASRLDCLSDFRMDLALDSRIDTALKVDIQRRLRWLVVNPLGSAPERDLQNASARYKLLQKSAEDGRLLARIEQERRFELSSFNESEKASAAKSMFHTVTIGVYKEQAVQQNTSAIDRDRRIAYQLAFLDSLIQSDTPPEVAYDHRRIESSVRELRSLVPSSGSSSLKLHAQDIVKRLRTQSHDIGLQTDCTAALDLMKQTNARETADAAASSHAGQRVALTLNGAE